MTRVAKVRVAMVAGLVGVLGSLASAVPAHAWECSRVGACEQAVMTVCVTVQKATHEYNCQ